MKQYLISVYQPDGDPPPPEFLDPIMRRVDAWEKEIQAAGGWVFSGKLHLADTATTVRKAGDDVLVTDGPYPEGKEHLGGFSIVKAPDLDVVLDWARGFTEITGLPVEVRPMRDDAAG
jgi:hypothetical protein